ncbi:hypothetical protein Pmani_009386 [Petrolisthes manimaculis]|uniref:Eclosion hormone n=1 Tax=Petrolisthes manimaculis TaxID=1843537 RepID=A0AAE1UIH1_9EUCA|nr:hypothetical protein Pmani_009386 [Petrolisthes manimaculis]
MIGSRKVTSGCLLVLSVVVLLLLLLLLPSPASSAAVGKSNFHICIKNCAQCKLMYTSSFNGGRCARFCEELGGRRFPDCGRRHNLVHLFLERQE